MTSTNKDAGAVPAGPTRRAKRLLAPSVKYEIFLQLVRGETTINAAADTAGVDRSTVMKLRQVAKEGALAALSASKPGGREVGPGCRVGGRERRCRPVVGGGEGVGGQAHPVGGKR